MNPVNEELIIRYIDGQLSAGEKNDFEKLLNDSPRLKKELEKYKAVKERLTVSGLESVDETYFNGIVPDFRSRLEKKRKAAPLKKAAYAFTVVLLFTGAFLFWKSYLENKGEQEIYQSISENITEDDMIEIADYLYGNDLIPASDEITVEELIDTNFNLEKIADEISDEESYSIISGYRINDLYSIASEKEWMEAYQQLLNKENL